MINALSFDSICIVDNGNGCYFRQETTSRDSKLLTLHTCRERLQEVTCVVNSCQTAHITVDAVLFELSEPVVSATLIPMVFSHVHAQMISAQRRKTRHLHRTPVMNHQRSKIPIHPRSWIVLCFHHCQGLARESAYCSAWSPNQCKKSAIYCDQ